MIATKKLLSSVFGPLLAACAPVLGLGCDQQDDFRPEDIEGLELEELEELELAIDEDLEGEHPWDGADELRSNEPADTPYYALTQGSWNTKIGDAANTSQWGGYSGGIGLHSIDTTGQPLNEFELYSLGWKVGSGGNLNKNGTKGAALEGQSFSIGEEPYGTWTYRIDDVRTNQAFHEYRISWRFYDEYAGSYTSSWISVCGGDWMVAIANVDYVSPQDGVVERPNTMTFFCIEDAIGKAKHWGVDPNVHGEKAFMAAIRMVTADYCGVAQSFTHSGTPVQYAFMGANVNSQPLAADGPIEAGWNENGAVCLNQSMIRNGAPLSSVSSACGGVLPPQCASSQYYGSIFWSKPPSP